MKLLNLLIDEDVLKAETALDKATVDNIVELAKRYLEKLKEYRDQLHQMSGLPEIRFAEQSALGRELVEQSRKAVRAAIELTTNERNRVEGLVDSFTLINGWDAAATFNRLKYRDTADWEVAASHISSPIGGRLGVQEAVEIAGRLRREIYVDERIKFTR